MKQQLGEVKIDLPGINEPKSIEVSMIWYNIISYINKMQHMVVHTMIVLVHITIVLYILGDFSFDQLDL